MGALESKNYNKIKIRKYKKSKMPPFPHLCFDFLKFFFSKLVLSIPFRKSLIGVVYGKKVFFQNLKK